MRRSKLDDAINGLFDEFGLVAILQALAERLRDEAAIADGEGDPGRGRWEHFAEWLDEIADDKVVGP